MSMTIMAAAIQAEIKVLCSTTAEYQQYMQEIRERHPKHSYLRIRMLYQVVKELAARRSQQRIEARIQNSMGKQAKMPRLLPIKKAEG